MSERPDGIKPRPRRGREGSSRSRPGKRQQGSDAARRTTDDVNARRRSIVLNHRRRTTRGPRRIAMSLRLVVIGRELDALEILLGELSES